MKNTVETDIAIIGGGISGLWLLNRLRQAGFSAILLESGTLGGGQTHRSQGIIHGGLKYALQGTLTTASKNVSDMPGIWEACLQGEGEIDLSRVPVLSKEQYLWSGGSFSSKLAGFFASMTLKSHIEALSKDAFPDIFKHSDFHGSVYALKEAVLDVHRLIYELMRSHEDVIFKIDPMQEEDLYCDESGGLSSIKIHASPMPSLDIHAKRYIFTAGEGNELIVKKLNSPAIAMQRRPLHMVIVKHTFSEPLYGHCLGLSTTPRLTVTTHRSEDGKSIWYLGGQLSEEGVKRSGQEQIAYAKQELRELFPWIDFSNASFASFYIDRAENYERDGARPDGPFVQQSGNVMVGWPIKLAFAPKLANAMLEKLQQSNIEHCVTDIRALRAWPIPAIVRPIWDQLFCSENTALEI